MFILLPSTIKSAPCRSKKKDRFQQGEGQQVDSVLPANPVEGGTIMGMRITLIVLFERIIF